MVLFVAQNIFRFFFFFFTIHEGIVAHLFESPQSGKPAFPESRYFWEKWNLEFRLSNAIGDRNKAAFKM